MPGEKKWSGVALTAIIIVVGVIGLTVTGENRRWSWLVTLGLLTLFVLIIGFAAKKNHWLGSLIDERNKMSLSRLQMLIWTIVILSAWLIAVLSRVADGVDDPVGLAVPEEVWIVLGISTTSLVGSLLLKARKMTLSATSPAAIVRNVSENDAQWTDIFMGEEGGNADFVDVAKVQMFFFTLVMAFVYAVMLGDMFSEAGTIEELPAFNEGMLALLGISHAGYLTKKAI